MRCVRYTSMLGLLANLTSIDAGARAHAAELWQARHNIEAKYRQTLDALLSL